jgi:hypothetical protein
MSLSTFASCSLLNKDGESSEYLNGASDIGSEATFDDFYSSPTDQEHVDSLRLTSDK